MTKMKVYKEKSYEIKMDISISPYLQKNFRYFIYLLSRFDISQKRNVKFYFTNDLVKDSMGDKSYYDVYWHPDGEGIAEIRISTIDYEKLVRQSNQGLCSAGACYTLLCTLGKDYILYMVRNKYPLLTRVNCFELLIYKIWERKLLKKYITICLEKTRKYEDDKELPHIVRKYIKDSRCEFLVDIDYTIDKKFLTIIQNFLQKMAKLESSNVSIRFLILNQAIKDSKGENLAGKIKFPPIDSRALSPLIIVSLFDLVNLKKENGIEQAYKIILHDIGLYYGQCIFWKKHRILSKNPVFEKLYLKRYEKKYLKSLLNSYLSN